MTFASAPWAERQKAHLEGRIKVVKHSLLTAHDPKVKGLEARLALYQKQLGELN